MLPDASLAPHNAALAGTLKLYERHLFICTGQQTWPAHIEQDGGFAQALVWSLAAAGANLALSVKVTACDLPSSQPDGFDLLLFPDGWRYLGVTAAHLPALAEDLRTGSASAPRLPHAPDAGRYVFVCTHGQRDARCGQCGPPLVERFTTELAARGLERSIIVARTSHVGGHAYAGNVLLYPGGDWYGYVTPDDTPRLIETAVLGGDILPDLWRGRLGLTPEQQMALHATLTNQS